MKLSKEEIQHWVDNSTLRYNYFEPENKLYKLYRIYIREPIEYEGFLPFVFIRLTIIAFITFLSLTAIYFIDSLFLEKQKGSGILVGKYYEGKSTNLMPIYLNKSVGLIPQASPDSFNLIININGLEDEIKTYQTLYDDLKINQEVQCIYSKGRLFNTIYIKSIE